jgi:Cohesin domain
MKKIVTLCLALSLFTGRVQAIQLILSSETGSVGTQAVLKLTTKDFTNVIAMQFSINFNPAVLQYDAISVSNPAPLGYKIGTNNTATGQLGFLWIDPALTGVSSSDNTELMQITFNIIGGAGTTSKLTISNAPTPFKALDGGLAYTATTSASGSVVISSILSIDLQSFTAKRRNPTTTDLAWQTASETNAGYFAIEQSNTGNNFQKIGEVKANGTTRTPQYYSFAHENPETALNYYRLKMVDADAQFKYSKIITSDGGKKGILSVQSRDNQLIINGLEANGEMAISVADMMGRILFSSKKRSNTEGSFSESMPYLLSGIYVFTVRSNQHCQSAKFFVK